MAEDMADLANWHSGGKEWPPFRDAEMPRRPRLMVTGTGAQDISNFPIGREESIIEN